MAGRRRISKKEEELAGLPARERLLRKFGKGIVPEDSGAMEFYSTGLPVVDEFIGGGIPKGRVIEIYGPESVGKSTIALFIAGKMQRAGESIYWIDLERAFHKGYAEKMGIDTEAESFLLLRPSTLESAGDIIQEYLKTETGGVTFIDSLAAGVPQGAFEAKDGASGGIASHSRSVGQLLQKVVDPLAKAGHTLVILNQMRTRFTGGFVAGEQTTGGWPIRHFTTLRLKVRRTGVREKDFRGEKIKVFDVLMTIIKTKVSKNEGAELGLWVVPEMGVGVAAARTTLEDAGIIAQTDNSEEE